MEQLQALIFGLGTEKSLGFEPLGNDGRDGNGAERGQLLWIQKIQQPEFLTLKALAQGQQW